MCLTSLITAPTLTRHDKEAKILSKSVPVAQLDRATDF